MHARCQCLISCARRSLNICWTLQESALFLMAVDRWKKLYERDFHDKEVTIASQFNDIIEEFIQEHAPNQVRRAVVVIPHG